MAESSSLVQESNEKLRLQFEEKNAKVAQLKKRIQAMEEAAEKRYTQNETKSKIRLATEEITPVLRQLTRLNLR